MNEEKLRMILEYLDKIAAKLNIGIEQVWPWFIKQQYVDAYVSFSYFLFFLALCSILLLVTFKLWKSEERYDKDRYMTSEQKKEEAEKVYPYSIVHSDHEYFWIWTNVGFLALLLVSGFLFTAEFFDIFNPEYHAFKDILSLLPK